MNKRKINVHQIKRDNPLNLRILAEAIAQKITKGEIEL